MYKKVDTKAVSKQLIDWSDPVKHADDIARLKLAAKYTPEGQKAWADIVLDMAQPIRSGLLDEDTIGDIFQVEPIDNLTTIEFPIDFYQVTDRDKIWAYAIPDTGYLPQRYMSAGSVQVSTYRIGNSMDFYIRYLEQARWAVLNRGLEVFRNGFVKKFNSDGWSTLMAAAFYRNIVVNDRLARPNQITPRLLSLMQVFMKRNGGGNMTSGGFRLTDLYISPEAAASMRSWDLSLVPESVRTAMFAKGEGTPIGNLFGIDINEHEDLGIGQPLQQLLTLPTSQGGFGLTLPPSTREVCIGMDRTNTGTYAKMPIVNPGIEVFPDNSSHTHRQQTIGFYGWCNIGFACLDNGWLLLGAF